MIEKYKRIKNNAYNTYNAPNPTAKILIYRKPELEL